MSCACWPSRGQATRPAVIVLDKSVLAYLPGDRTTAAEHRYRHRLVDQPRRFGREAVAVQPHQRERIVRIVDGGRNKRVGTFAHETRVGTVQQDDGTAGIRPGKKSVDIFSAERNHD